MNPSPALIFVLAGSMVVRSAESTAPKTGEIRWVMEGTTNVLTGMAKAVGSSVGGISVMAFSKDLRREHKMISLQLPEARTGTFSLKDSPGLRLDFSRSVISSRSDDHYTLTREMEGAWFEVTLTKVGDIGDTVEGTFWAVARRSSLAALAGPDLVLTNGTFSVVRTKSVEKAPLK